jgi:hypothetical protein
MAVEYSISIILGRHQNSEYYTLTSIILEKYSKNTSEVLSGGVNLIWRWTSDFSFNAWSVGRFLLL